MKSLKVSPLLHNKNSLMQNFLISLSLILYPATVLSIPNMNGLISGLLALAGIILMIKQRRTRTQASRDEMLFYFALSVFFLATLTATLNAGFQYGATGKFLHLLLAIPLYIYLRHTGIKLQYLWYGLVIGALIAVSISINEVWIQGAPRARGLTHPIIFGDIALTLGCMSMAGIGWFKARATWQISLPILALIGSLLVSALSASRGSWVAIPFLAIIFFWYMKPHFTGKFKGLFAALLISTLGAIYLVPQTNVSNNINRTINNLKLYSESNVSTDLTSNSVGSRLEMWQAAWAMYTEHPILGVGWPNYKSHAQKQVEQGLRNPAAATFPHPHNQFLSVLANGGSLSFIAILFLFLIPARIFFRQIKQSKSKDIQRLALVGLVLIVAYMSYGFSEAILERSRPVNFLAFYLAVIMAAIYEQQHLTKSVKYHRKHSLSVTVIAKDEADRIDDCLKSVTNWADEIIVLDSGSTDNTVEIAKRYTDKVFVTDWPGYGLQKQRALEKASCEWVLSVDADERVSSELRNDIDEVLSQDTPDCSGYQTPWAVILYNHRMDFGRSARAPLRLFKREGAHFTDSQIHEHIILPAPQTMRKLNGRLLHLTHRDYGHGLFKSGNYAWLSSQKYFAENRWGGGLIGATLRAGWTFFLIYFLRLGMLDGSAGFLSAMNYTQNSFNKYAGLWSLKREKRFKDNNH